MSIPSAAADLAAPPAAPSPPPAPSSRRALGLVAIALALLILALMASKRAKLTGDSTEYVLMTVAMASHGSPDIRLDDIAQGRLLMPVLHRELAALEQGMREGKEMPLPGFYKGRDGKTYAIHFHAYSTLAALPYRLLRWTGAPPLKCYQAVNLAMVFVLGLALLRLFGTAPRALAGVALYMLCGGALYWNWTSPECLSAAALLAGLAYFCSGAPLRGGLLIGVASLQNPSIVLTLGAVPALLCCVRPAAQGWLDGARAALRPRMLLGLALGGTLFALPVLFNLHTFGVASIIAKIGTAKELIGAGRLHSLYFDLNQGMIVAIPAMAAMLLLWGWRGMDAAQRRRRAAALALCVLLTVAYAIPAMAVHNWNSGAAGVMRYAFWSAMPLLFLLFWRLRGENRWPLPVLAVVIVAQAWAMSAADDYNEVQFGPMAKLAMARAPGLYNPEPEIFAERAGGAELAWLDPQQVHVYKVDGVAVKTMVHGDNARPGERMCGPGQTLAGGERVAIGRGWSYLNGPVRCVARVSVGPREFTAGPAVMLGAGWSVVEQAPGQAPGLWSEGSASSLTIAYGRAGAYTQVVLAGRYFEGNRRTRVKLNGVDLGWQDLQAGAPLAIPAAAEASAVRVELQHEAPRSPGPQDGRLLAYYMLRVELQ
ncbi:hypothetical protein [Pseudoduganella namucuonensis]|uniref:Uncharacterized protein n=1 Tax=Pseudoduganella namucuonensis TaxID=1035707 RepID=A0A1I7FSR7_9BURK|nr:hypothetical protein [Pseudoduganella namucuonensis]SFU39264.1 hypothetical protein SAMN05216552_1002264 [Pseudoduganella namucuonensis]